MMFCLAERPKHYQDPSTLLILVKIVPKAAEEEYNMVVDNSPSFERSQHSDIENVSTEFKGININHNAYE